MFVNVAFQDMFYFVKAVLVNVVFLGNFIQKGCNCDCGIPS